MDDYVYPQCSGVRCQRRLGLKSGQSNRKRNVELHENGIGFHVEQHKPQRRLVAKQKNPESSNDSGF